MNTLGKSLGTFRDALIGNERLGGREVCHAECSLKRSDAPEAKAQSTSFLILNPAATESNRGERVRIELHGGGDETAEARLGELEAVGAGVEVALIEIF